MMALDIRSVNQLAVNAGREMQSPRTGYVHYTYHQLQGPYDTIPVKENLLFALALFRSKTAEQVREAKGMLEGLLHFQDSSGNFPVYLHEYPRCADAWLAVQLMPPLIWIQKQFAHILGDELRAKLKTALEGLRSYCLASMERVDPPVHFQILIDACLGKTVPRPLDFRTRNSPERLGMVLTAWQLGGQEPWPELTEWLSQSWHRGTASYVGPGAEVYHYGAEPELTLYDLMLAYWTQRMPERAKRLRAEHLQASLIQPFKQTLPELTLPFSTSGEVEGHSWHLTQAKDYAYAALERTGDEPCGIVRGYHPFRLLWGDLEKTHSFVCQAGRGRVSFARCEDQSLQLSWELTDPPKVEDRKKAREVALFTERDGADFLVEGKKATSFQFGDKVSCRQGGLCVEVDFTCDSEEPRYFGHLMPGNRKAERLTTEFIANDWQLFLRAVERSCPCNIEARLHWYKE